MYYSNLEGNAESLTELQRRLTAFVGRRMLVRSRLFVIVLIKTMAVDEEGVRFSAELVMPLEESERAKIFPKHFKWAASKELLGGGNGALFASYVSWALFYDEDLNASLAGELDSPKPNLDRMRSIIADWGAERDKKRTAYFAAQAKHPEQFGNA